MDRIAKSFQPTSAYEPVSTRDGDRLGDDFGEEEVYEPSLNGETQSYFSRAQYSVFLLLGVAMLWAWNMFLAAAPYFHRRFEENDWILNHFQPAETSVSALTSLGAMFVLSNMQERASYPNRITLALVISSTSFALLAVSTLIGSSATAYFVFLMAVIFISSLGTALMQNGLFSFVAGFNQPKYMQAVMTGQAIAGVLPPMVQIASVFAADRSSPSQVEQTGKSSNAALAYFIAAVTVSVAALLAFLLLARQVGQLPYSNRSVTQPLLTHSTNDLIQQDREQHIDTPTANKNYNKNDDDHEKDAVPLMTLFWKLPFLSAALFMCFAVSMVFPVLTILITSVNDIKPAIFIPLAFLLWNTGDLVGRLLNLLPSLSLIHHPFALFSISMARLLFIPLYFLCNLRDQGAIVASDFFYLIVVQFLFGVSNGFLASQCMIGAAEWVLAEERPAAGSFMGLVLIGGLTAGSLLSFLFGDV